MNDIVESKTAEVDVINHPSHYTAENVNITIEPIQLCEQCGFLVGNGLKYLIRYKHKDNPLQDLKKAEYYFNRWIKSIEKDNDLVDLRVFPTKKNYIFQAFQQLPYFKDMTRFYSDVMIVRALLDWTRQQISDLEMKSVEMGK